MNINALARTAFEMAGVTAADVARMKDWDPGRITSKLCRNSMKASEFFDMMELIGIEVKLVKRDTAAEVKAFTKGHGKRVRMMVEGVMYDTEKASALANSFYADGVNEFNDEGKATELYRDQDGRYFFAEYINWDGGRNVISPVPNEVAARFVEKYGTEIEKNPL